MKTYLWLLIGLLGSSCSNSQSQGKNEITPTLIGRCEGCEAIFEYGSKELTPVDTLPDFDFDGTKLKVTGTIFQPDGKTPAEGVILYVYHTNRDGIYPTRGNETGWARQHGFIRGWVKTGKDGRYSFYTQRPGSYPKTENPQHIHPTILEPDGKYYYINNYFFDDDPFLPDRIRYSDSATGGKGSILVLKEEGDLLVGRWNIVLGKNVKGYPK